MKTVTAAYRAAAEAPYGKSSLYLFKFFYGASSFFLAAKKYMKIGTDEYKAYVLSNSSITHEVSEVPGLGIKGQFDVRLRKSYFGDTTSQNLLTQISKGKKVQVWHFYEGLADADKLPCGDFVIEEIADITEGEFTVRCVSPETKLEFQIPELIFDRTRFPDTVDSVVGIGEPIIFGDFHSLNFIANPEDEYLWCQRPQNVPVPAFLIDIYNKKWLSHEAPHAAVILPDTDRELMMWLEEWKAYAFCKNHANSLSYSATTSGGQVLITITSSTRYVRINPSEQHFANSATNWKNAIDLDHTTTCAIASGQDLMVQFSAKPQLTYTQTGLRYIGFEVTAVSGTIDVYDGTVGGSETLRGSFSTVGFKEIQGASGSGGIDINGDYYIKISVGTGESCTINGLHIKIIFGDKRTLYETFVLPGTPFVNTPPYIHIAKPPFLGRRPSKEAKSYRSDYFWNSYGLQFNVDSQGYDYRHPIYMTAYFLRHLLGYASTEMDYATITNAYLWLSTGNFPNAWYFAASLQELRTAADWLQTIMEQCQCWLFWGEDGKWKVVPINFATIITDIKTFKDTDPSFPIKNLIWYRSNLIFNKFILNYDFEYATGQYRGQKIYDKNNKTALANSVTDYGQEVIYPVQDYSNVRSVQVCDNIYQVLEKLWPTQLRIIEFDTRAAMHYHEVGDNFRTSHPDQTWSTTTDLQILRKEQIDEDSIHIVAKEIVP